MLRYRFIPALLICLLQISSDHTRAGSDVAGKIAQPSRRPQRVLVTDGSNVHNLGELSVHVANWGLIGSMPGSGQPFSAAASAEWPARSGIEYLNAAGLWVGGIILGVPSVSTSVFEAEFRPTQDPRDIIYRSAEGDPGGLRDFDDDGDGEIDEEWHDGRDNDGDGQIDEDFAAISDQMFSCWYTDNEPIATQIYPQHRPLNIEVHQATYQWADDRFDDFIGIEYTITNIGVETIQDMCVGMYMDADAGVGARFLYWEDDAAQYYTDDWCVDLGGDRFGIGYIHDEDGDRGLTPGYIGIRLLGKRPPGATSSFVITAAGEPPYAGGDPINDFGRYQIMSSGYIDYSRTAPRDYRILFSRGPYPDLPPGGSVAVQFAMVAGDASQYVFLPDALLDNATHAKIAYEGQWVDGDGDPATGVRGRETPVYGPATVVVDSCACPTCPPVDVGVGEVVWINADCVEEEAARQRCNYTSADSLLFRTGVGGREKQVHWSIPPGGATAAGETPTSQTLLGQNYPNPFNPATAIPFRVETAGRVTLRVYDVRGRRVRTLIDEHREAGPGVARWDGRDDVGRPVATGVYFYSLTTETTRHSRRMVLMK